MQGEFKVRRETGDSRLNIAIAPASDETSGAYFFCAALILAHRALAALLIAALASALMVNFFFFDGSAVLCAFLILAQRAFWAAQILARPAPLAITTLVGNTASIVFDGWLTRAIRSSPRPSQCHASY
jgi:hypothetical protein